VAQLGNHSSQNLQNGKLAEFAPFKVLQIHRKDYIADLTFQAQRYPIMSDRVKIVLEFPVRSSAPMLYNFLSTPSGLAEWFCDDVNSRGDKFTFIWGDSEEVAFLVRKKQSQFIQYKWDYDESDEKFSFEFRIEIDELTGDGLLLVTDHVEPEEEQEMRLLWQSQINTLLRTIGS
jgi:uncharacterized protein YndB with AHSA1/START domain